MNKLPISPQTPWLAPLAGYSDLPFRLLCREYGADVAVTEMVSAKGLIYGTNNTLPLADTTDEDNPLVVQLFGAEPEIFPPAMDILLERGHKYFDLNSGCPVKKVLKTGSGSGLLRTPDTLVAIAKAMVDKAGENAVGVKLRLGYFNNEETVGEVARRLEDVGVAWLALHPRYSKQGFTGTAHWERLAAFVDAASVPVIGSGDLFSAADAVRMVRETGVDAVMFARGALLDPTVFRKYKKLLKGEEAPRSSGPDIAATVRRHVSLAREHQGSYRALKKMRSLIPRYVKGLRGAREMRNRLIRCEDWNELDLICKDIEGLTPDEP